MNWYLMVLKKYATFNGRARRKEYWYFVLCNTLIIVAITVLDYLVGSYSAQYKTGLFSTIYKAAVFCPGLAVWFRRLHDAGTTNKWITQIMITPLIVMAAAWFVSSIVQRSVAAMPNTTSFLAIVSSAVMLIAALVFLYGSCVSTYILIFRGSQEGTNQYGPNPIDEEEKPQR